MPLPLHASQATSETRPLPTFTRLQVSGCPGSLLAIRHPVNSPGAAGVLGVCGAAAGTPTYLNPSGWRHQPTSPPHPIQRKLFLRLQLSSGEIQHLPSLDSLPDGVSSFPSIKAPKGLLLETHPHQWAGTHPSKAVPLPIALTIRAI